MVELQFPLGLYCAMAVTPSAMRALMFAVESQAASWPADMPFAP